MNRSANWSARVVTALLVMVCTAVGAEDDMMAERVATCAACHGADGISSIDTYPNLAGQKREYLIYAMKAYQDKERNGDQANIMQQQAENLSAADIEAIASYYSALR